jgi:hypothetical protein
MFEIWNALLNVVALFIIPDWGGLVALIPFAILALVVVVFAIVFWRLLTAPTASHGFQRVEPATRSGIHPRG